ncbi:MAG: hypothetical protein Q9199_007342, partial [Rusavskia elegans]
PGHNMHVKTIPPVEASMSMGEIGKAIQELKQNYKISFELYELNKKDWNTNWVTDSKPLVQISLLVGSSLTPLSAGFYDKCHPYGILSEYYTNPTPAAALVSQAERLKLDKCPLEAATVTKHLERIRSLIYGLRQAAIEHPESKTLDTAIMGVKESSEQNGMTQNTLQDNQDVWNVVHITDGTVTVEEDVAGQFEGEGENEIADWDLCE